MLHRDSKIADVDIETARAIVRAVLGGKERHIVAREADIDLLQVNGIMHPKAWLCGFTREELVAIRIELQFKAPVALVAEKYGLPVFVVVSMKKHGEIKEHRLQRRLQARSEKPR